MFRKLAVGAAAFVALSALAIPAHAQGSESYKFLKAVRERDGAEVDKMLASPNPVLVNTREMGKGDTALHIVTSQRNMDWLRFLIGKGARPDIQNSEGNTPLSVAAMLGWSEGAEQLLARGARVDVANGRGETPLILAVQKRDLPMVRLLMSKGADPKKADRIAGYSALDYAKRDARSVAILKALEAPAEKPKAIAGPSL